MYVDADKKWFPSISKPGRLFIFYDLLVDFFVKQTRPDNYLSFRFTTRIFLYPSKTGRPIHYVDEISMIVNRLHIFQF